MQVQNGDVSCKESRLHEGFQSSLQTQEDAAEIHTRFRPNSTKLDTKTMKQVAVSFTCANSARYSLSPLWCSSCLKLPEKKSWLSSREEFTVSFAMYLPVTNACALSWCHNVTQWLSCLIPLSIQRLQRSRLISQNPG